MVKRLFLAVPRGCLQFVIVVFPDHTNLLFLMPNRIKTLFNKKLSASPTFDKTMHGILGFSEVKNAFLSLQAR